jgi:phospholipase C
MRNRCALMPVSRLAAGAAGICLLAAAGFPMAAIADSGGAFPTATPIRHLVVIFQENVSFDHYFATYPAALNLPGEPRFRASPDTPSVNGLGTLVGGQPDGVLLTGNPMRTTRRTAPTARKPRRATRTTIMGTSSWLSTRG